MTTKRDADDSGATDMEAGMTTAERRRRRRRGGGIRVPSDNVPRSRAPTGPPPPRPEDPALAMSIAYSFTNDASGPVPRAVEHQEHSAATLADPDAHGGGDFETKTREMSAVDLEALGLEDPSGSATTLKVLRSSSPGLPLPESTIRERITPADLDAVEVEVEPGAAARARTPAPATAPKGRQPTLALSEEDLEEVRAAVAQVQAQRSKSGSTPPPLKPTTKPPPVGGAKASQPAITPPSASKDDAKDEPKEPQSAPEIDLNELQMRADSSGEIEVDVDDAAESGPKQAAAPAEAKPAEAKPAAGARSTAELKPLERPSDAKPGEAKAPPPPPPAKLPPSPPAALKKPPAGASAPNKKPWYLDLFDEDYLRTLPFLTPEATQAEAEFVTQALALQPGAHVLDVGCGYGRHAMELATRGFHMVGLDLSQSLVARGGEEAARRGLDIEFVRRDMREIDFDAQFDAAYCLFSTFGYFDDETNKKVLQNIAHGLKPNGKVAIEILNRDYLIADLPTRVWWEGDGCVVLEEVELNYFSSRIQVNRSVVFDDGRQLEQEISLRAYSLHEVGKLMHAAGFRVLEVSGGYQTRGRFFGNQSRHIIVVAERKDPAPGQPAT